MSIQFHQTKSITELKQILALQQKNLSQQLTKEERSKEGFVTVTHSLALLERMHTMCPHIVAKDENNVIGYALCMHPSFADDIAILKPLVIQINSCIPKEVSYIIMGQICIAKEYRKRGVFRNLYAAMQQLTQPQYQTIITAVDTANTRSLQAHYATGFQDLKSYTSRGQDWKLIQLS